MKKVFSWRAYVKNMGDCFNTYEEFANHLVPRNWVKLCEGKTKEEINRMGYRTIDNWMVEKED